MSLYKDHNRVIILITTFNRGFECAVGNLHTRLCSDRFIDRGVHGHEQSEASRQRLLAQPGR